MSLYGYSRGNSETDIDELQDTVDELVGDVGALNSFVGSINTNNANKLSLSGGTMTGTLAMGVNKITSSYTPVDNVDLTNKLYVDTEISDFNSVIVNLDNAKLNKTGGTLTGPLLVDSNAFVTGNLVVTGTFSAGGSIVTDSFVQSTGQSAIISNSTSVLKITSGYPVITYIPYTGTLDNYKELVIFNNTSNIVILGHNGSSENGCLRCLFYQLFPKRSVKVVFDPVDLRWVLQHIPSDFMNKFKFIKWVDDTLLNIFINPGLNYHVKINFYNSNTTVNGVTGIEYVTTATSGTNWDWSYINGSFLGHDNSNPLVSANFLTSSESIKLNGFIYNATHADFRITNLTVGNYYMLQLYHQIRDNSTNRVLRVLRYDANGDEQFLQDYNIQYYSYGVAGTNRPAMLSTYVFRTDINTTEIFKFVIGAWTSIDAIFVVNLGALL